MKVLLWNHTHSTSRVVENSSLKIQFAISYWLLKVAKRHALRKPRKRQSRQWCKQRVCWNWFDIQSLRFNLNWTYPRAVISASMLFSPKAWPCSVMWILGGLVMAVQVLFGKVRWQECMHVDNRPIGVACLALILGSTCLGQRQVVGAGP